MGGFLTNQRDIGQFEPFDRERVAVCVHEQYLIEFGELLRRGHVVVVVYRL